MGPNSHNNPVDSNALQVVHHKTYSLMIVLLLTSMLAASGCATIRGGAFRDVQLTSEPAGAAVRVTDADGKDVFTGSTPTVARLKAGAGYFRPAAYTVSFERAGYVSYSLPMRTHVDWFLYVVGNIPLGVLPGVVWIDPSSGAMWAFEREIHAKLNQQPERDR